MNFSSVNFENLTPVNFVKRSAAVYPDKAAVVNGSKIYSYRVFFLRINRLASALKKIGIGKGDKVAFIAPNIPPMLEAHFAVPMIGAVLVTINIRLSPGEVAFILKHSDARVCFVDNEFAGLVKPVLSDLPDVRKFINICDVDDGRPLEGQDYESFLETGSPAEMDIDIDS